MCLNAGFPSSFKQLLQLFVYIRTSRAFVVLFSMCVFVIFCFLIWFGRSCLSLSFWLRLGSFGKTTCFLFFCVCLFVCHYFLLAITIPQCVNMWFFSICLFFLFFLVPKYWKYWPSIGCRWNDRSTVLTLAFASYIKGIEVIVSNIFDAYFLVEAVWFCFLFFVFERLWSPKKFRHLIELKVEFKFVFKESLFRSF